MKKANTPPPPWKRKKTKGRSGTKLTEEQKEQARARAEAAGRRYPNLVDNMWAAKQGRKPEDFPF